MKTSVGSLPLILVLDNIRSLHNVGAIFRSADGAGIQEIVLSSLTPAPPRHEISKTALGATETVPWGVQPDLSQYLKEMKVKGYTTAALEQTPSSTNLFQTELPFPLILIAGHEREGVQPDILALCSLHLHIPMYGQSAHSLNVANASSITLFEARRQFSQS